VCQIAEKKGEEVWMCRMGVCGYEVDCLVYTDSAIWIGKGNEGLYKGDLWNEVKEVGKEV
jgi:hypothetical protein